MPQVEPKSADFQFLARHDPHLLKLATGAEAYCFTEPDLSLIELPEKLEDNKERRAQVRLRRATHP